VMKTKIINGKFPKGDKLFIDVFRRMVKFDVVIDGSGNKFEMDKDELIALLLK